MQEEGEGRAFLGEGGQPAGVIEMPVAQHHGIDGLQRDIEAARVVCQNAALAGVKEDAVAAVFNPERKSVFRQKAAP